MSELDADIFGNKFWWMDDKLHREDGPAVEYPNGNKFWYLDDKLHREDGPAVEYPNGNKFWYLHGHEVTMEDVITDPKERFWWRMKSD